MWSYFRSPGIEFGLPDPVCRGQLKPHVHTDVQIMFVTHGSRRVVLGGHRVVVPSGSALVIPSGIAHVADGDDWEGFNAYVRPEHLANRSARIIRFEQPIDGAGRLGRHDHSLQLAQLTGVLMQGETIWADPGLKAFRPGDPAMDDWPQSREGQIRKYQREAGITPHAHFNAMRLDAARRMLAAGASIAAVAADLDFTDQSHLGRQFRATFGITPGRYASG